MLRIPIPAKPALSFAVTLGGQRCNIKIRQLTTGVYMDVAIGTVSIVSTAICLDRVRVIRYKYLGFIGDLMFVDTQGKTDPDYTGFGSRYQLVYVEAADE